MEAASDFASAAAIAVQLLAFTVFVTQNAQNQRAHNAALYLQWRECITLMYTQLTQPQAALSDHCQQWEPRQVIRMTNCVRDKKGRR